MRLRRRGVDHPVAPHVFAEASGVLNQLGDKVPDVSDVRLEFDEPLIDQRLAWAMRADAAAAASGKPAATQTASGASLCQLSTWISPEATWAM